MNAKGISTNNMLMGIVVILLSIILIQDKAYSSGSEVPEQAPTAADLNSIPLDNAKEVSEFLRQGINVSPSFEKIMSMVDQPTLDKVFPDGLTTYLEQDFTDRVPNELTGVDLSSFEPITLVQNGVETIVGYVKKGEIFRAFFD
jgi:hypothetical protein